MFDPSDPGVEALLGPLRADPARSAVLTDVDGTLAPIVERSGDAAVPQATRELLERLSEAYALVGCVSGRPSTEVREMVGLSGLAYSGNHGFEVLRPGEDEPSLAPGVEDGTAAVEEFVAGLDRDETARRGLRLEDKGAIQALHWRGAEDPQAAEALVEEIAGAAGSAGLGVHRGRLVLELRPPLELSKGTAIAALLDGPGAPGLDAALYAGDDRTDIDGFECLRKLVRDGRLDHTVCVGIDSPEAPDQLAPASDLVLAGPEGFAALLGALLPG